MPWDQMYNTFYQLVKVRKEQAEEAQQGDPKNSEGGAWINTAGNKMSMSEGLINAVVAAVKNIGKYSL